MIFVIIRQFFKIKIGKNIAVYHKKRFIFQKFSGIFYRTARSKDFRLMNKNKFCLIFF